MAHALAPRFWEQVDSRFDRFAIGLSSLCLAHCVASTVLLALASAFAVAGDADSGYRRIEGGDFRSSVRFEEDTLVVRVPSFALMARPVSNRDFAGFLARQPQWRRDRIPVVFASPGYLGHWATADAPGSAAR